MKANKCVEIIIPGSLQEDWGVVWTSLVMFCPLALFYIYSGEIISSTVTFTFRVYRLFVTTINTLSMQHLCLSTALPAYLKWLFCMYLNIFLVFEVLMQISSVCSVLDTNTTVLCIVLHADKLIWIYLQLTKAPYPKSDPNYGYSSLHLLKQIASYVRDEFGWSNINHDAVHAMPPWVYSKDYPATELSAGFRTHTARISSLAAEEESTWVNLQRQEGVSAWALPTGLILQPVLLF